jgi:hypothetical protein
MPALAPQLVALTASLTTSLLTALSALTVRKQAVLRYIGLLIRIHAGAAARATFLRMRAQLIAKRTRAVPLRGDIAMYAHDLAVVVFTTIKHTAEWFLAACRLNNDASGTSSSSSAGPKLTFHQVSWTGRVNKSRSSPTSFTPKSMALTKTRRSFNVRSTSLTRSRRRCAPCRMRTS